MTDDRPWLSAYPEGVPADLPLQAYSSLVALMRESFDRTSHPTTCAMY